MDQREMLRQLEEHFRHEDERLAEHRQRVREQQEAISDEEWWEEAKAKMGKMRPEFLEMMERNKAEMIKNRSLNFLSDETFRERRIKRQAAELLPFVAALRSESEASGDITSDEIAKASMRMSAKQIDSGLSKMEQNAHKIEDPWRRQMVEKFTELGREDQKDLQRFQGDEPLTDELVNEVTDKLLERSHEMMEYMRTHRRIDLDELN